MKQEKKNRRVSKVWEFFTKIGADGSAECNFCGLHMSYRSTTTNLSKHIKRKHRGALATQESTYEDDPRDALKEFITMESGDGSNNEADEADDNEDALSGILEWVPPKKLPRKSEGSHKKMKPEVISSNGVDYLVYSREQSQTRSPTSNVVSTRRNTTTMPASSRAASNPSRPAGIVVEEDEFSCFAKFLSKRIRAIDDPYWQSCVINEINVAFHRVEMRRFEQPRTSVGVVQTEPMIVGELVRGRQIVAEEVASDDVA